VVTPAVFELIFLDFAAERIAMDAEQASGSRLIALGVIHSAFDKASLEFSERFVKQNAAIDHLANQSFQLILHSYIPPKCRSGALLRIKQTAES
jgi:hypothetical protein